MGFWLILHGQKCPKLCSILETGENLRILEYLEMGVAKWLNSATWNSPYVCTQPLGLPWTDLHQNRKTGVSWPDTQKSLKGHYENLNRKSAILHLVAILAIFQHFLLWRTCHRAFIQSTSNLDESHLNKMEIKTNSKINFPSHRVTVAWPQSLVKRHQNTRFCISDIHDPIESKLDM